MDPPTRSDEFWRTRPEGDDEGAETIVLVAVGNRAGLVERLRLLASRPTLAAESHHR